MCACRIPPLGEESGAVLVESSICLGAFLFSLVVACDLLRMSYTYLALEHAVQMTASWAAMGEVSSGLTRVATIKNELGRRAGRLGLTVDPSKIWVCDSSSPAICSVEDAGAPHQPFQITVRYPVHLISFHAQFPLQLEAQALNEPSS